MEKIAILVVCGKIKIKNKTIDFHSEHNKKRKIYLYSRLKGQKSIFILKN